MPPPCLLALHQIVPHQQASSQRDSALHSLPASLQPLVRRDFDSDKQQRRVQDGGHMARVQEHLELLPKEGLVRDRRGA